MLIQPNPNPKLADRPLSITAESTARHVQNFIAVRNYRDQRHYCEQIKRKPPPGEDDPFVGWKPSISISYFAWFTASTFLTSHLRSIRRYVHQLIWVILLGSYTIVMWCECVAFAENASFKVVAWFSYHCSLHELSMDKRQQWLLFNKTGV